MTATPSTFDAILKDSYDEKNVEDLVYPDHPLLTLIPKDQKSGGRRIVVPVKYADVGGSSHTFSTAQANKVATKTEDFLVTHVRDYTLASIDGMLIEQSKGDAHAFAEAITFEMDSAFQNASRRLAVQLYGDIGGSRGQIGTIDGASTSVTLASRGDITNFEVGQEIMAASGSTGTTPTTALTVTKVDRDAGKITFSANPDSVYMTANGYLFVEGDVGNSLAGLAAWLPATAPGGSDSFYGVNRSVDPTRMAGIRLSQGSDTLEETFINACERAGENGARPDHLFISFRKFGELVKELAGRKRYDNAVGKTPSGASVGFNAVVLDGPRGPVKVVPDSNCPDNRAYMLDLKTWKLKTMKGAPRLLDADGNKILRDASADAYEVRVGYYGNLICTAPGRNVVITLNA